MKSLAEIIAQNYPKTLTLEDGTSVMLRPMLKSDEDALLKYFQSLPPEDLLCLKEKVTEPEVIETWVYNLDFDNILPLLALHDGQIVGDATLHFSPIGWTRHQGEVRLTTDPQHRVKGLGTVLIQNLIDIARDMGLEQLTAEIPPALDKASYLFEKLGFKKVTVLKGFVMDKDNRESDLALMVKSLLEPANQTQPS
jgi:L-amino acid N-acyltransferase YncA